MTAPRSDAQKIYEAAFKARAELAQALRQDATPMHIRNEPRQSKPLFMHTRFFEAVYQAFHDLDIAIDGWAYRIGPEDA